MARMENRSLGAWRVEGRVQGVGFRYFVMREARSLGLAGWATNLEDGAVEVHAAGPAAGLGALEAALKEGPPHAKVLRVSSLAPSTALERKETFTIE